MKIVVCNKFFFVSGGTDRYLFELIDEISKRGHKVIPFSVKHTLSKPSEYTKYFLPPPGPPDQIFFSQIKLRQTNILRLLDRSIYSFEAQKYLNRLLKKEGPIDIGYILNIYNYMSPSIIRVFKKHKIPLVHMIGDYNLQCPAYNFLRNGKPCTLCVKNKFYHALFYRCVKKSFLATLLRVLSMYLYALTNIYQLIDRFIVPCQFMKNMLIKNGYPESKIILLKYPIKYVNLKDIDFPKQNYILYFGRISYEKGLDVLIEAYQKIAERHNVKLVILGRDYDGEMFRLGKLIKPQFQEKILFPGFAEGRDLSRWIAGALFTVVPSRWYDNAPFSIYESLAHCVPVVAAQIGGITEQIEEGVTGRLFQPESASDLASKMEWMLADEERLKVMGMVGRQRVLYENGYERHVDCLIKVFEELIHNKNFRGEHGQ